MARPKKAEELEGFAEDQAVVIEAEEASTTAAKDPSADLLEAKTADEANRAATKILRSLRNSGGNVDALHGQINLLKNQLRRAGAKGKGK